MVEGLGVSFEEIVDVVAKVLEAVGVLVIVGGIFWSGISYLRSGTPESDTSAYSFFRRSLGRSILLGLEFLVAADIIHTVATTPTFRSLGVLGLLIVIRTFLSIEIEMELDGRWPWQKGNDAHRSTSDA
jgi:uncharacterized membrane protein